MKAKIKLVLSVLLVSILLFFTIYSTYAVTQQDIQDTKDEINEIEKELKEVQNNLSEEMKQLDSLDGDIAEVQYNLDVVQKNLKELEKEISELEKELELKKAEYDKKHNLACERVVRQYKYGKKTILDVFLNSTSLTDFLSSYYTLNEILELDEQLLDELEKEKEKIESDKITLEDKKKKAEEEKIQVQKQKTTLTNKRNERQNIVSKLNAEDAALQKEKEAKSAELARQEEEWRRLAQQNSNTGGSYSGGSLEFPCPGYTRVSSYFGSRGSPLAGGSSYHKGIDLAAPKGKAILASEAGTVIAVYTGCSHNYGKSRSCGCGSGFGNYIMVSHGGGLVTVYAHCSTINVGLGSKVARGSIIATVGSTGASTGYHLHYGVLKNGTYVNPAPYIGL